MAPTIATTDEEISATFPLMKQLRPHLSEHAYLNTIRRLQSEYGYRLAVLFEDGEAKAAAGYRLTENLAWGRSMYVDDLITDGESRFRGYATRIFDWLEEEIERHGCAMMHLDSGVHRHDAHRFYLNRKMKISCHHFDKSYN